MLSDPDGLLQDPQPTTPRSPPFSFPKPIPGSLRKEEEKRKKKGRHYCTHAQISERKNMSGVVHGAFATNSVLLTSGEQRIRVPRIPRTHARTHANTKSAKTYEGSSSARIHSSLLPKTPFRGGPLPQDPERGEERAGRAAQKKGPLSYLSYPFPIYHIWFPDFPCSPIRVTPISSYIHTYILNHNAQRNTPVAPTFSAHVCFSFLFLSRPQENLARPPFAPSPMMNGAKKEMKKGKK